MKVSLWFPFAIALLLNQAEAGAIEKIRIGAMAGGTLAWELAAMRNEGLLTDAGIELEETTMANPQAGKVALQAGSVDIILSDWIWVSSMRTDGNDLSFYPYSDISAGLLVPNDSRIETLADLSGKKLGIAGGELDKNWLFLQALGQKQGLDLTNSLEKVYGAAPLLSQQLSMGRIDALLTYWQFAARLEAQGKYRQLLNGETLLRELGINEAVPNMGYVFKQSWADQHKTSLQKFFQLAKTARDRLCNNDNSWQKIGNLTESDDPATQSRLRSRYCEGRVEQWNLAKQQAAEAIYQMLRKLDNNKLTGKSEKIAAGTFWSAD